VKFCPECGQQRNSGLFCGGCGFKFPKPKDSACPDCGKERLDGIFCGNCGYRFTTQPNSAQNGGITTSLDRGLEDSNQNSQQKELTSRLQYGKGFSKALNCTNCGELKAKSRKTCKLCEAEIS
jgi:ribosomal protein L32